MTEEYTFPEIPEFTTCDTMYPPDPIAISSAKVSACLSNYRDKNQNTLAHFAVWTNNHNLLDRLIAHQHDIMQQPNSLRMVPNDLAPFQYIERLRHWPRVDEDITHYVDSHGNNILHYEVVYSCTEFQQFVYDWIVTYNHDGFTPYDMWPIQLVIQYGANYIKQTNKK